MFLACFSRVLFLGFLIVSWSISLPFGYCQWDPAIPVFNYHPFPDPDERFFKQPNGDIYAIKPEVLEVRGDTVVLGSFSSMTQEADALGVYFHCFSPDFSWPFQKIEVRHGGEWIIYTRLAPLNEQFEGIGRIRILSNATPGESWTSVQENVETVRVEAEVLGIFPIEVFGVLDTMKIIAFHSEEFEAFDSLQLAIGKTTGLLGMVNFLHFEYSYFSNDLWLNSYEIQGNMELVGKGEAGVRNLTRLQVFDFLPGEELHIFRMIGHTVMDYTGLEEKLRILERWESGDTVGYKIARDTRMTEVSSGDSTIHFERDTFMETYTSDSLFDQLPGTFLKNGYDYSYTLQKVWNGIDARYVPGDILFYEGDDSCYGNYIIDGCISQLGYIRGLGGPYYACQSFIDGSEHARELRYFKKGNLEWGVPFDFTVNVVNGGQEPVFSLFPNPAKDRVTIATRSVTGGRFEVQVIDLNGRIALDQFEFDAQFDIELDQLSPGMYIIKVLINGKSAEVLKLLIH